MEEVQFQGRNLRSILSMFMLRSLPFSNGRLVNISQCVVQSQNFIIGRPKAHGMEFPHMAAVGFNLKNGGIGWYCGGTLISEIFVLSTASCSYAPRRGNAEWVRVGDLNLVSSGDGATPVDRRITEIIKHPDYKPPPQYHDIALLRLESRVPFNSWIRPACLHTSPTTGNSKAIATGWGTIEWLDEEGSSDLKKLVMPLIDSQTCTTRWNTGSIDTKIPQGVIADWMICAVNEISDTCSGDGGGPLVIYSKPEYYCMYDLIGITSLGKFCNSGLPALYTRVYHYIPWIESTVWSQG